MPKHPPRKRLLCRLDPGILRVPVLDNTETVSYACKRTPVPGITLICAGKTTSCTLVSNICATNGYMKLLNSTNFWGQVFAYSETDLSLHTATTDEALYFIESIEPFLSRFSFLGSTLERKIFW